MFAPANNSANNTADPRDRPFVRLLHGSNRAFVRMFHHLDVLTPCHLPPSGRAILVCNHTSGLDPHLIQSCCNRLVTWMMAKEYYEIPMFRPLLDAIGVIPVARDGRDSTATRAALRALNHEQLLGIFPEGRIETAGELLPFQTGVALLAIRTKAPVYPAYLDGSQRGMEMKQAFLKPQRSLIAFGPEVNFDRTDTSKKGLAAATAVMEKAIRSLRDHVPELRHHRGV